MSIISGNNLREIRKSKGYKSARELAEALGKPISTITSHENGQRTINDEYIDLYCSFFNVSRKRLLGEEDTHLNPVILKKIIKGFCLAQESQTKKRYDCIDDQVIDYVMKNIESLPELNEDYIQTMIESVIIQKSI